VSGRRSKAALIAALILGSPASARADPAAISPMIDELQRIQVQIARGDKASYDAQTKQLKAIAAAIAAAKPASFGDRREADSLAIDILSGGSLVEIVPLLERDAVLESERPLVRGVAAYMTNHEADAERLLAKLDLNALDRRVAGQVAFARSVLEATRDPKAAIDLLDWARLVAPGSLVEEAALRREVALLAEQRDAGRVSQLARQYATRFDASPYAADFFRQLAQSVARFGLADDPANFALLMSAAATLAVDDKRVFLLALAKAAIVNGRYEAAAAAAAEALRGARPDSAEEARSRLYIDGYEAALADLKSLAPGRLDRSDAALLASVRSVASQLRLTPSASAVEAQAPSNAGADGPQSTIGLAGETLKRTDKLAEGIADP
jgi:chemotaxis protein MotC